MRDEGGTLRRVRLSLIDVEKYKKHWILTFKYFFFVFFQRYSLFPGQIVACRGTNPTGRLFEVKTKKKKDLNFNFWNDFNTD